jgi:hypothetical protein
VIANFIYELATGHQQRFDKLPGVDAPSPQLQKILDDACHIRHSAGETGFLRNSISEIVVRQSF